MFSFAARRNPKSCAAASSESILTIPQSEWNIGPKELVEVWMANPRRKIYRCPRACGLFQIALAGQRLAAETKAECPPLKKSIANASASSIRSLFRFDGKRQAQTLRWANKPSRPGSRQESEIGGAFTPAKNLRRRTAEKAAAVVLVFGLAAGCVSVPEKQALPEELPIPSSWFGAATVSETDEPLWWDSFLSEEL